MRDITFKIKSLKRLILFGFMLFALNALGQVQQGFTPRFSDVVNGDFTTIANNTVSNTAMSSYTGTADNHDFTTVYVDIDSDPNTFNSSRANFSNPSPSSTCVTIAKAYLYWAAADKEYSGNTGNGGAEPVWNYNQVQLMLPGATNYTTITADQTIYRGRDTHFVNDPYVCVKDITTEVQGLTSPYGSFQVANVKGTEGVLRSHGSGGQTGTSGGWQIVFVYESPELVARNITIFDGYANVTQTQNLFNVDFNGFQTVSNGAVNSNIVIGALEGDRSLTGDALEILDTTSSWVPISTTQRPANNFFNSKITINENPYLDRFPASTNTLGFDAAYFPLANAGNTIIANNQTSATVRMTSNQETYGLFLMGLSVEVFEPSLGALSFTTNVIGANFDPGDNAPVEIRIKNVGNDDIQNLEIALTLPPQVEFLNTEPLPPGVTYNFDTITRELRFFVQDGYTDIGDPEYQLDFNLFINNECVTCSADIGLQALATFNGVINPNIVGTLSSGTVDACGIGNHDPTYLHVTPVLSINDGSAVEGNNIVIGISSSHLLAEDALLSLTYNNITASGSDYAIVNTFTVPTGTGNTSFNIPALDDTIIETTETFDLVASSTANITLLDNTATGSIIDNDLIPGVGIAFTNTDVIVTEGTDAFAVYNVTLTGNISENVTVDYTTNEGTALNPVDFTTTTGTLTFTPTIGSLDIQVPITDDTVIEPTETFTVVLSNIVSNLGIGFVDGNTTNTANGTINDDDATTPGNGIAFSNSNVIVTEGTDAFAIYTVTLTGGISENVTVDYTTNEGTALNPGDFTTTNGTLTFTPTIGSLDIQVPITDDAVIEPQENFSLTLSNIVSNLGVGFVSGNATDVANGTINDDDANTPGNGIAFTNTNVIVTEGTDAFAVYNVTLTGAISENVTVDYTTNEGTALNPGDFTTTNGNLTFTPTIGSLDIQIPITDDLIIEPTEAFTVVLSNIVSNLGIGFVDGNTTNTASGTINDDDGGTGTGIAFTNTNVIVTEGTDAFAVYNVTLTGAISENVTVDYTTNEGTALNPGDFTTTNGNLTFTPTIGSLDIQIPITDDLIIEPTEAFTVVLSNIVSNLGIGFVDGNTTNTASGTINDDDGGTGTGIAFTNTNVIVTEGTDAFAVYTVTLTGAISENITVDYTTNEGTALNPGDFTTTNGTLTFTPTIGSLDIQVPITDDLIIEPTEAFTVVLSNIVSNLGISFVDGNTTNTASGTINDDDGGPGTGIAFTNTNVIVTEGTDAFAVYNVTLTGAISENVTVDYTTNEGTALNPGDFTTTNGTLTFTPTIGSLDIQVPIIDDLIIEPTEAFTVVLSNIVSNLGIGFVDGNTTNTASGTINDDDGGTGTGIAFTNTNVIVTEGTDAFAVYTVTLTGAISENVTVDYTTNEGTALNPGDFTTTNGTLTFTPTIGSLDIQVPITDDLIIEPTEAFTVVLSNIVSNLGIGFVDGNTTNTANGTINDDDANTPGNGIAFTNTNVIVTEGTDAFAVYNVTLTGAISENVTVDYTTNEGTALNPGDFTTTNGTLTFTPTIGSLDIQVPITDDLIIEPTEAFTVVLSNIVSNLGIGFVDGNTTNTANGTINDDDGGTGTGIAFTNTNVIVTEGTDAFAVYNVTLTGAISENVTVDYTTNEGTALNPGDFTTTTGTLTFTPTIGSLDIQVPITDDTVIEPTETFTVVLSNIVSNLGIGFVDGNTTNTANGTINDDDGGTGTGIAFTNTNVIVTEGTDAFAVYTVTLTGAISENVTVDYTTNEGTALNPGDFTTTTGTLTFTPTIGSLDIQVPITDDTVIEPTETFTVVLSNIVSNLGIGFVDGNTTNTANGTINDDDGGTGTGIAFTNTNVIVTEGTDAFAVYTVTLTGAISENVTVDYTTNEGTALNPGDFTTTNGTLTFTPTIGSLDIQVPITDDLIIEPTEAFTVVLSNIVSNLGIGFVDGNTTNTANGTINDDDGGTGTGIAFTNTNVFVIEGTDAFAVYTVTLTGAISENVTVDYTTNEGTALNPGDFTTTNGTLTFTPTIGSLDIQVPITDDLIIEPTEAFTVVLSNIVSNLGIGFVDGNTTNTANGTISDDDAGPGISITDTNVTVTEGTDAFAIYNVTLIGNISENVSVDYTTNEGTALNPGDFTTTTGTLTFTPTIGSLNIQVPITDDLIIEPQENFSITLSNIVTNLAVGFVDGNATNTANGTINDDDGGPGTGIAFTNTDVIVTEGTDAFAVYTVTLTGVISENVTVDYTTNEGTALNISDFTATTGTLTFTPTASSFDIQVPIIDDMVIESTEDFTVILSNIQSNVGIGFINGNTTNTANGTINDDDMGEIVVEPYQEEMTIVCGEEIPEVPTLIFSGGCGNYVVDYSEIEQAASDSDDFVIIRTWNVTDSCGNTATFEQLIFVMQAEKEFYTIDICVEDPAIDLLDYLPADFDTTGTFTVEDGVVLNGSIFEPDNHKVGEYLITYAAEDTSCKFYVDFTINVNADCLPCDINDLEVSKTITVNGDGINDYFEITGLESCGFTYQVMIFNRWGTKVYEAIDYQNDWGGYAPNSSVGSAGILPTGTYYYMISLSNTEIAPVNGYIYIGSK